MQRMNPPSRGLVALVLVAGLALARTAWADTETQPRRQGFAIGVGLGSGATRAFGIKGMGGAGGSANIHVGTTASERMLWVLQLDIAADPQTVTEGDTEKTVLNQHSTLCLGLQYYVREVLWLKAGGGFAGLALGRDPQAQVDERRRMSGLGLMASSGYDVLRSGIFALSLEFDLSIGLYGDGAVTSTGLHLSANWY